MKDRPRMKCLECGWIGYEDELKPSIYKEHGACPTCRTILQRPSLYK